MSGSRARSSNSVSLFPFLAVLVCAMGALIFLLIVTTRRIRSEALAKAKVQQQQVEEQLPTVLVQPNLPLPTEPRSVGSRFPSVSEPEPPREPERIESIPGFVSLGESQSLPVLPRKIKPPPPPEPIHPAAIAEKPAPPDPNNPLRAEIEKLEADRKAWLAHIAKKEQKAADLKQETDRLTTSLKEINSQIEAVANHRLENSKTQRELQDQQQRVLGQLAKVEQEIADAKNRVNGAPTKFQVVPFDGQTGTNYRPIIIECTAQGMRFQPEGVVLNEADFDGFTLGKNPLLAGANALSDYWMRVSVRSGGKEPAPYVLLIVRPSGARYFAAKQLLDALDRPFGYELVEEDLPIDVPPLDPKAAELCRAAVEGTLKERENLKRLLIAHGPEMLSKNPRYRVTREPGGGFDVEYAPDGGSRAIEGVGPEPGTEGDNFPATDRYGRPYRDLPGEGEGEGDEKSPKRFGAGSHQNDPRSPQRIGGGPLAGRTERNPSVDSPGTNNARNPDWRTNQNGEGAGGRVPEPNEPRMLPEDLIRRSQGNLPYRENESNTGRYGNPVEAPAPSDRSEPGENLGNTEDRLSNANTGEPSDSEGSRDPDAGAISPDANRDPNLRANPNGVTNTQPRNTQPRNTEPTSPDPSDTPVTGRPPNANAATTRSGQPGQAGSVPTGDEPPMPNFLSMNARRSLNRAEPYQRRWGLSDPRASIGFEREITVQVESNRLVVGNAFQVSYSNKSPKDELAAGMLQALELTARKWGRPPLSFYWVPTIKFQVGADQVPVFQHLDKTARAWGLETSAEAAR